MKRLAGLCLVFVLAAPVLADPPTIAPPPPPKLFLSPSGEPFRPEPGKPDPFDAWFDQADADHDGAIDRTEFRADAARFFKRLDANGDGVIDGFEITAYEKNIVPELFAEAEGPAQGADVGGLSRADGDRGDGGADHDAGREEQARDQGGGKHSRGGPRPRPIAQLLDEPEPVSGADLDFDGRVTFAEWMKAADERFDLLDKAGTGRLTREALKAILAGPPKPKR